MRALERLIVCQSYAQEAAVALGRNNSMYGPTIFKQRRRISKKLRETRLRHVIVRAEYVGKVGDETWSSLRIA